MPRRMVKRDRNEFWNQQLPCRNTNSKCLQPPWGLPPLRKSYVRWLIPFWNRYYLESPDDFSQHDQDKSPCLTVALKQEVKTPALPKLKALVPKPLFHEVPIPPVITETRTEVVHVIREPWASAGDAPPSQPEEPVSPKPSPTFGGTGTKAHHV